MVDQVVALVASDRRGLAEEGPISPRGRADICGRAGQAEKPLVEKRDIFFERCRGVALVHADEDDLGALLRRWRKLPVNRREIAQRGGTDVRATGEPEAQQHRLPAQVLEPDGFPVVVGQRKIVGRMRVGIILAEPRRRRLFGDRKENDQHGDRGDGTGRKQDQRDPAGAGVVVSVPGHSADGHIQMNCPCLSSGFGC